MHRQIEGTGEHGDVVEANVPLSPLNTPDVTAVQPRVVGETLLREAAVSPQNTNAPSEEDAQGRLPIYLSI